MSEDEKFERFYANNVPISEEFWNQMPGYGALTPDGSIFLLKEHKTDDFYLLLYPEVYPEEYFEWVKKGANLIVPPEGYVILSRGELELLVKAYEKLTIEEARGKLEDNLG